MPRLLSWPVGLVPKKLTVLEGPRTISSGGKESLTGFVQSVQTPFGAWRYQFVFDRTQAAKSRRLRGLYTALHGGANAVRVPWFDNAALRPSEWGVTGYSALVNWSNSKPWSNGIGWRGGPPLVAVSAAAGKGATTVSLVSEYWKPFLGIGDMIGFMPYHFGWYQVTEVKTDGSFRIWPPLRAALTANSYCTLEPILVMRLRSEKDTTFEMEPGSSAESTMILAEVLDETVRAVYTD